MSQAPVTATPWRRDQEELLPRLSRWAEHAFGPGTTIGNLAAPEGTGMSSETVLFELHTRDRDLSCVARLAPLPSFIPVFPEYDLELQRVGMELVGAHTSVPVPTVVELVSDESWLGTPFLVMERIDGVAPTDVPPYVFGGWVSELAAGELAALERNAVAVLAGVHRITAEGHDLSRFARPGHGDTPLRQQLGYQRWYYDWARDGLTYPLIEQTLAWLDARMPEEGPAVLNWGDARIGNMLFRGVEVVGVLDWEMAAVGPAEVDIAWLAFLHRFFQSMADRYGVPGLPHFLTPSRVARLYEELSGRRVADLQWFEVFAALRFAVVSVRTSTRSIAYGTMDKPDDPDDLIMFRGLLEQMLEGSYWR